MLLSERKKIDLSVILECKTRFLKLGLDFDVFKPLDDDGSIVLRIKDCSFLFKSYGDAFEYLRPVLQAIENAEEEGKRKERYLGSFLIDAVERVAKVYDKEVYTFSLAKHDSDG